MLEIPEGLSGAALFHITFGVPVRVMLQDKSVPVAAVTAEISMPDRQPSTRHLRCKTIFPVLGGVMKASITIITTPDNIAGAVEVKQP